jgi:hypothetical protein
MSLVRSIHSKSLCKSSTRSPARKVPPNDLAKHAARPRMAGSLSVSTVKFFVCIYLNQFVLGDVMTVRVELAPRSLCFIQ